MTSKKKNRVKKKQSAKTIKLKTRLTKDEKKIAEIDLLTDKLNKSLGVAVHTKFSESTPAKYLGEITEFTDFRYDDRAVILDLSRRLRKYEGICSTVGDLLADFCITDGYFECEDAELEKLLNFWYSWVNSVQENESFISQTPGLKEFARKVFDDWLTDGDAVFTEFWDKTKIKIPGMSKAFRIPSSLKSLDVSILEISEILAQVGIEQIILKLNDDVKNSILRPKTDEDKILVRLVPPEWIKNIKSKKDILLDPLTVHHLKRNGKDYSSWGEGYYIRAFSAVAFKRRIQALDASTVSGLINRLTILKLGLEDKEKNPAYHIPTPARVSMLFDMVTNPKASNMFIWPGPDLDVLDIGPDGKILDMKAKYDQADKDILRALHVSPLLIDGSSAGTGSRDWATFISTRVGLEVFRNSFAQEMNRIARRIAELNGYKDVLPSFRFKAQLLNDDRIRKTFLTSLYEFGLIDPETIITESNFDFEIVKRRKIRDRKEGLDDLFVNRNLPYQGQGEPSVQTPVETKEKKTTEESKEGDEVKAKVKANIDWLMREVSKEVDENVEEYSKRLDTIYTSILDSTQDSIEKGDDQEKVLSGIAATFVAFSLVVDEILKKSFLMQYGGEKVPAKWKVLMSQWNDGYIAGFLKDLQTGVKEVFGKENLEALVNDVFETQRYRVNMYVTEGSRKAMWLGFLARSEEQDFKGGRWICHFVNSCSFCMEHHGGIYSLGELASIFPPHPECRCDVEFFK